MLIKIHNHENNTTTVYNKDPNVTIKELKELYHGTTNIEDIRA